MYSLRILLAPYFLIAALAASILAFTESRLKLAPFCIGGCLPAPCPANG